MVEIRDWEFDWNSEEIKRERKLKIKESKHRSSFNLIMMTQVKNVYKKIKNVESVMIKFPHLLPETVRFYVKTNQLEVI